MASPYRSPDPPTRRRLPDPCYSLTRPIAAAPPWLLALPPSLTGFIAQKEFRSIVTPLAWSGSLAPFGGLADPARRVEDRTAASRCRILGVRLNGNVDELQSNRLSRNEWTARPVRIAAFIRARLVRASVGRGRTAPVCRTLEHAAREIGLDARHDVEVRQVHLAGQFFEEMRPVHWPWSDPPPWGPQDSRRSPCRCIGPHSHAPELFA